MKKITLIIMAIALIFTLSACNSSQNSIFKQANFLEDSRTQSVTGVNEYLHYSVRFETEVQDSALKINIDSQNSSYVTTLTDTTFGDTYCYLLTTKLVVVGEMVNGEEKVILNDSIDTECYFLGTGDNLKPLYSKRVVKAHSPHLKGENEYTINYYEYEIETKYLATAQVSFKIGENNQGTFDLCDGFSTEYQNYNKNTYIDNELLLFSARAMDLNGINASFYTIDALSNVNRKMKITNAEVATENITEQNLFYLNSKAVSNVTAQNVIFSIDSNYPGNGIKASYATPSQPELRCAMLSMSQSAFYGLGEFKYSLKYANN